MKVVDLDRDCIGSIALGLVNVCAASAAPFSVLEHEWIFWLSVSTAAAFVALAIPRVLYLLVRCPAITRAPGFVLVAKLTVGIAFAGLRLGLLIVAIRQSKTIGNHQPARRVASTALDFVASFLLLALSPLEHFKSAHPSILVCIFLLLAFVYDITRGPSLWPVARHFDADANSYAFKALFTAVIPTEFVFLVLESARRHCWVVWNAVDHSPEETSSVLSLGVYAWLNPLLWRGYHAPLAMQHLYPLDRAISVDTLNDKNMFSTEDESAGTSTWQLILWLVKPLGWYLLLPVLPRLFLLGFTFCQPFLIQRLLSFLSSPEDDSLTASALISVAVFTYLGIAFSTALYWYYQERFQSLLRAFLISAIYRKTSHALHVGEGDPAAVTLMGADVERVYTGFRLMHEFWANAIQIALTLWLLQRQLGLAFLAPLLLVFFGFSISFVLSRRAVPYQTAWMARVQARTGVTSAVLAHIKDLRVSGMTTPATILVKDEREAEIQVGARSRLLTAISASLSQLPQAVAPAVAFAFGPHALDQTRAFTTLSLLGLLTSPLMVVLQVPPIIAASFACLRRIREYLVREGRVDKRLFETEDGKNNEKSEKLCPNQGAFVTIQDGSFGWTKENAVLKNINLQLPKSSITFIRGPMGSGKSTLCRAILAEVPYVKGAMVLNSAKLGYCDQAPVLFNASIIENIIGFSSFDTVRYAEVIQATQLSEDLRNLPAGDKTIIGTKGISLSGGQRQRVSLARALYHDAEMLVLDDVLSGLDGSTQDQVCQSVLGPAGLLRRRGTTALVCTHSTQYLSVADHVITLSSDGTIVERGDFSEIQRAQSTGVSDALEATTLLSKHTVGSDEIIIQETSATTETIASHAPCINLPSSKRSLASVPIYTPTADTKVYRHWLSTIGPWPLLLFLVLIAGNGFFSNFPTIWLKLWSSDSMSTTPKHSFAFWIGLYALLGAAAVLCVFPAGLIMLRTGVRLTGTKLHHAAIDTVMHSSLRFLSSTDVGRVLNLFSQDMNIMDTQLPRMVNNMGFTLSNAIGQAVVIAASSAWLSISYPLFIALLWAVQRIYLPSSKRLRILDLEAKTPLYTNFLDTLTALPTIRAFGWFPQQLARNNSLLDDSQRPSYLLAMAQQWLMFTMNFIVAILAVMLVALSTQLRSSAGNVGAGLVTLMSLGSTLTTIIIAYTGLETSLGAISRLKSFGEETEVEDCKSKVILPDKGWPATGQVHMQGVDASYTSTGRVLKDLTLCFKDGEKIAICGRTGSGKSSILALLLRLIEPIRPDSINTAEATIFPILIDGIPLNTVDQTILRERLLSASQDAVFLPDGSSFRANLDPWGAASTAECTAVLHDLDLAGIVEAKGGLEAPASGGELSAGQKQMFGLARVVLRRLVKIRETKIDGGLLLLDEITSSVDAETVRLVKRLLNVDFAAYTVVMVTHHREMAVACDRVIMLDAGRVVEEGSPEELLDRESGWFRALWEDQKSR